LDLKSGFLKPVPPYDFEQVLNYIKEYPATQNDQTVVSNQLIKAFRQQDKTFAMQVVSKGTVDEPRLKCTIISEGQMNEMDLENAVRKVRFYLGVDEDLKQFYELARDDELFQPLVNSYYGHHLVKFLSIFEAVVWAILMKEFHTEQAGSIKKNIQKRLGSIININGVIYRAFPGPDDILRIAEDELKLAIPDTAIREQIIDSAEFLRNVDKYELRDQSYSSVKEKLLKLNGIDERAAIFILRHGLGRTREIMYTDSQLTTAVTRIYGRRHRIDLNKIKELADHYGVWKGYWAHYLKLDNTGAFP